MDAELAKEPLKTLLGDLYDLAKGPLKKRLKELQTERAIEKRRSYLQWIANVKTIWQTDREVEIAEFYRPAQIFIEEERVEIHRIADLIKETSVVIEGIAGQGKSILLRHLCCEEWVRDDLVPVFIQLRYIDSDHSIAALIAQAFDTMGFPESPEVFDYLAESGRLVLCLDGFDEIHSDFVGQTIRDIEETLSKFQNLRVLATSRPGNEMQQSTRFRVHRIVPLDAQARTELIRHLAPQEETDFLLDALKRRSLTAGILTTPLLVTLLVITYKSERYVPRELSEFYESLFTTLLRRHDKTKPGFHRERRSQLGDIEFSRIFDAFSFLCIKNYKTSLTEDELHEYAGRALQQGELSRSLATQFITDVLSITCLVVRDGTDYRFVHKSIPEFFAARFVARQPEEAVDPFYRQFIDSDPPDFWYQTLAFLGEIDPHRFVKHLMLPYFARTFRVASTNPPRSMPRLNREEYLELVGPVASVRLWRRSDPRAYERVILSSDNWLVKTLIGDNITQDLATFLSRLTAMRLERILGPKDQIQMGIDRLFDSHKLWRDFLVYQNQPTSQLAKAYGQIHKYREGLRATVSENRDILDLNLKERAPANEAH